MKRIARKGPAVIAGLAWFSEEDWLTLKTSADDRDSLHETYQEWEEDLDRNLERLRGLGYQVRKIPIDLQELYAWCLREGRPVDGRARAEFTTLKVREAAQEEQPPG